MAILEVKDLTKNFGATEVLKGITFELQEGKVLSVIGSSGSGKTTLLRCINGLETATSGKITVSCLPDKGSKNHPASTQTSPRIPTHQSAQKITSRITEPPPAHPMQPGKTS